MEINRFGDVYQDGRFFVNHSNLHNVDFSAKKIEKLRFFNINESVNSDIGETPIEIHW